MPAITTIKRRTDFLAAAASGLKCAKSTVVVQMRRRGGSEPSLSAIRIGFTATKKTGNAVIRNRIKRRLRAAAAQTVPQAAIAGCDYVFIGREGTYKGSFDDLIRDMKHALKRLADQAQDARNQKPEV